MGRKWANIVAKKTAKDGANSKVYAKFGVEIYVAAKQGEPDPESNSALKFVLERAKQAQVPTTLRCGWLRASASLMRPVSIRCCT